MNARELSWLEAGSLCLLTAALTYSALRTRDAQVRKRDFVICTTVAVEQDAGVAGVEFAECDDGRQIVLPAFESPHHPGEQWRSWWPDKRGK